MQIQLPNQKDRIYSMLQGSLLNGLSPGGNTADAVHPGLGKKRSRLLIGFDQLTDEHILADHLITLIQPSGASMRPIWMPVRVS